MQRCCHERVTNVGLLVLSVGVDGAVPELAGPDIEHRSTGRESADIDAVLDERDGRRLVLDTDLAGLVGVLHRLLRRGELDTAELAMLPREPVGYLARMGLPSDQSAQLQLALHGRPRLVGVIKDDSGGVCLDSASVRPWQSPDRATFRGPGAQKVARSGGFWVRAVVDDQRLVDGQARSLTVRRLGPTELEATVQLGRFRSRTLGGRSLQLACDEALVTQDGIDRERARSKRTFWSEPTLLNLVLPTP
jgi:hypothetical protein